MAINGKCKREYTITLDGKSFDLIMKALGWATYHKEDLIKSSTADKSKEMKKVANLADDNKKKTTERFYEDITRSHQDDYKSVVYLRTELGKLK